MNYFSFEYGEQSKLIVQIAMRVPDVFEFDQPVLFQETHSILLVDFVSIRIFFEN